MMVMRLRLYHHRDGARIAYRETGTGPPLVLLHSLGLSHREWEPIVAPLSRRFRVILPDLPLHGDSEDRPRHPYTPDWLADVIAGFCREVAGPRPLVAGHDIGAELALQLITSGRLQVARLVLMPNRLHRRDQFGGTGRPSCCMSQVIEDLGVVPLTKPLLVSHVRPAIQPQMVMPCTAAVLRKIGICDWKTASCCASLAWLTSYSVM
jgi:pimeloyl-ACP methyl ester carboxylesterase